MLSFFVWITIGGGVVVELVHLLWSIRCGAFALSCWSYSLCFFLLVVIEPGKTVDGMWNSLFYMNIKFRIPLLALWWSSEETKQRRHLNCFR